VSNDVATVVAKLENKVADLKTEIERLKKQKLPWISVSERLPEVSATYIVSDGKRVSTAFYNKQTGNFVFPDGSYATLAHWMLMPEPPV